MDRAFDVGRQGSGTSPFPVVALSLFPSASHQQQMSNPLSSHLHFISSSSSSRSPVPPARSALLVTDTLAASADFLLVHFLTAQLRRGKHVVFLACGEAEGHWKALAKKLVSLIIRFLLFLFDWDRVDPSDSLILRLGGRGRLSTPSPTSPSSTASPKPTPLTRPRRTLLRRWTTSFDRSTTES